eukprot:10404782-Alexandrium_andersonii.AAC.1
MRPRSASSPAASSKHQMASSRNDTPPPPRREQTRLIRKGGHPALLRCVLQMLEIAPARLGQLARQAAP